MVAAVDGPVQEKTDHATERCVNNHFGIDVRGGGDGLRGGGDLMLLPLPLQALWPWRRGV